MCKGPEESEFVASFEKPQKFGMDRVQGEDSGGEADDGELGNLAGQFLEPVSS